MWTFLPNVATIEVYFLVSKKYFKKNNSVINYQSFTGRAPHYAKPYNRLEFSQMICCLLTKSDV